MKQIEQASSASSASPIAKMIRATTAAEIAIPEITRVSDGPLGLGEGDFGSGFGAGQGSGMGDGGTLFGRQGGGGGLVGRLFDMKQSRSGDAVSYDPGVRPFFDRVMAVANQGFSEASLKDYYQAKAKMQFTYLAIPYISADEGPKAFQAEKEIEPRGWFVHYRGNIVPPREGEWRFHGFFDDCLLVFINGKLIFDGSWDQASGDATVHQVSEMPRFHASKPVHVGKWVRIKRGDRIDIVVGERPGGFMGGTLMIEEKGKGIRDGKLPLFSTTRIGSKGWEFISQTGYGGFAREMPVFRISSGVGIGR